MALDVTPIYRNLRTSVTFFGLEAEALFAILSVAVVMNICGRFLNREMFGLPMNMVLQYLVPILSVPALMLFKYGKQRGYLLDWVLFHTKPHVYSALDFVIGCVDTRKARRAIDKWVLSSRAQYWLDLGNSASSGQFVLGQPKNSANRKKKDRLPTVAELYPEILKGDEKKDDLPSCSAAEALTRQEPF